MQLSQLWGRVLSTLVATAFVAGTVGAADQEKDKKVAPALDFTMKSLEGKDVELSKFQGKVVLIVNVASECGLTPQYEQLEALHEKYGEKGLAVLGFPCNQFGSQEPGSAAEIKEFCSTQYGVKFPMFSKIDVNGENAAPLYKFLKAQNTEPKGTGEITWNFEKFLLDRDGNVVARFEPKTRPDAPEVLKAIEAELAKN